MSRMIVVVPDTMEGTVGSVRMLGQNGRLHDVRVSLNAVVQGEAPATSEMRYRHVLQ